MRCINCEIAVNKLRRHVLTSLSEHEQTRLARWITTGQTQPSTSNYVCHGCWMKAKHGEAAHNSSRGSKENEVNNKSLVKLKLDSPPEPPCQNDPHHQNELPHQNEQPPRQTRLVKEMPLPNYRKAATTSTICIFQRCTNSQLHLVPVYIKQQLLLKFKFYIPPSCKICESHLCSNRWHSLPQMAETDTRSMFNGEEISDLLDTLSAEPNLSDLEKILKKPNHTCQYCTKLTVPQFFYLFIIIIVITYSLGTWYSVRQTS